MTVSILLGTAALAINAITPSESSASEKSGGYIAAPETPQLPEATLQAVSITPEPMPTEPTEPVEEPMPAVRIYDIPLAEDLQTYTFELCKEHGVDYEMVLALIERESSYRASVISKTNDYGMMQINTINHETLKAELGVTDFLDPEQNILCGVYLIGKLTAKYDDPHRILMAYNMGETGAKRYVEKGNANSAYSRAIMERRAEFLQEGGMQE